MNMISIDPETCNLCGVCVVRCTRNFQKHAEEVTTTASPETCIRCGHCVSLCPEDAIVHHKMDMDNFARLDRSLAVDPDTFDAFVRSRRSVRAFKKKRIPRDVLERLVDLARYAPTGSNKQDVEILVIEDAERMDRLSALTEQFIAELYPTWKNDEGAGVTTKADPIFYKAPALMIFHQPKASGKTDSIITAQTLVLSAITHGLGSCYIGFLEYSWHHSQEVRDIVGLPEDHTIGSVLILGYPHLKYLREVDRLPMRVRWE